jgi:hypothetical protein
LICATHAAVPAKKRAHAPIPAVRPILRIGFVNVQGFSPIPAIAAVCSAIPAIPAITASSAILIWDIEKSRIPAFADIATITASSAIPAIDRAIAAFASLAAIGIIINLVAYKTCDVVRTQIMTISAVTAVSAECVTAAISTSPAYGLCDLATTWGYNGSPCKIDIRLINNDPKIGFVSKPINNRNNRIDANALATIAAIAAVPGIAHASTQPGIARCACIAT